LSLKNWRYCNDAKERCFGNNCYGGQSFAEEFRNKEKGGRYSKKNQEGETTGDKIRDFVISANGVIAPELEDIFRGLKADLLKYRGEPVLIIK